MNVYVVRQRKNERKIWNRITPFLRCVPLFLVLPLIFLQILDWRTVYRVQDARPGDPALGALFRAPESRLVVVDRRE
jgi:hypothetical protein